MPGKARAAALGLVRRLQAAFSDVERPTKIVGVSFAEEEEIKCAVRGRHWRDIANAVGPGNGWWLAMMTPKAYRYYLPGYILAAIVRPQEADVAVESLVNGLVKPEPADEGEEKRFLQRMGPLALAQKRVVREFLEYMVEEAHGNEIAPREPSLALERYWGQFKVKPGKKGSRGG